MSNPPPPPPPPQQPQFNPTPQGPGFGAAPSNGMGVAALVLGIIAIISGIFFIGALFGLLAVIFGFIGRGKAKRNEATNGGAALAGIITGFVGIAISAAMIVFTIWLVNSDEFKSFTDCIDAADGNETKVVDCELDFGR